MSNKKNSNTVQKPLELVHSSLFVAMATEMFGSAEEAENTLAWLEQEIAWARDTPDVLLATDEGSLRSSSVGTHGGHVLVTYFRCAHQPCVHLIAICPTPEPTELELLLRVSVLAQQLAYWAFRLHGKYPDASVRVLKAANALGYGEAEPIHVPVSH